MDDNRRIVRVPLRPETIRAMDDLIERGVGGFADRSEFIGDAVESQILELTYPSAGGGQPSVPIMVAAAPERPQRDEVLTLGAPTARTIERSDAEILHSHMFGLHNRDYPSLWAAHFLATRYDGPIETETFMGDVTSAAWEVGRRLEHIGSSSSMKLTPIFPTNQEKSQAAVDGFRAFAIGEFLSAKGWMTVRGPLFGWGVCQLGKVDGAQFIGITEVGKDLLQRLEGLDAFLPHDEEYAQVFLDHLWQHAPLDFWGFEAVMRSAVRGITRDELVSDIAEHQADWTPAEVETNTAGYVSRCREWGLLESRQVKRRYVVTPYGESMLSKWAEQ